MNSTSAGGIVLTGDLKAANTFGGEITVVNNTPFFMNKSYGIYAKNITVENGLLDTDVNISGSNGKKNSYSDEKGTYIDENGFSKFEAIAADGVLNAEAFSGDIVVKVNTAQISADVVGLRATQFTNSNDGIFDITGTISVSNSNRNGFVFGIVNKTVENLHTPAYNLRISGEVSSSETAIGVTQVIYDESGVHAWVSVQGKDSEDEKGNKYLDDRIQVAAGGKVQGDINLNAGTNTLILDSNAYVNGDILFDQGKLNLFYRLNSKAMDGVVSQAPRGAGILNISDTVFDSRTHITVDMNDAAVGEYILISDAGSSTNWYDRSIDITFQGLTQMGLKGYTWSTYSDDKNNYI